MANQNKNIILHLGLHKTGSSFLQHALANYEDSKASPYILLSVHSKKKQDHLKLRKFVNIFRNAFLTGELQDIQQAKCTPAFQELKTIINNQVKGTNKETIIISDENFLGVPMGQHMPGGSYFERAYYPQRINMAQLLSEALAQFKIQVVWYYRQPASLIESLYSNTVKNLSFSGDISEYLGCVDAHTIDYDQIKSDLDKSFDLKTHRLPYAILTESRSQYFQEFKRATGIDVPKNYWPTQAINTKLPDRHILKARQLASKPVSSDLQARFHQYLKSQTAEKNDTFELTKLPEVLANSLNNPD